MREGEQQSRKHAKRLRKSMTEAEIVLWVFLRRRALHGCKFRRQHPIGPYIADFACVSARLVVEVDGATHATEEELAHDARRSAFLRSAGWTILRVTNSDVFENLDGVWLAIERLLPPSSPRIKSGATLPPHAGEESGATEGGR